MAITLQVVCVLFILAAVFVNEFLRTIEKDGTWAKLWKICFGDRIGGVEEIPEPPVIPE